MIYDPNKHKERIGIDDELTDHWVSVDVDTNGEVQFAEARDRSNRLISTTEEQRRAMVEFAKAVISKRSIL